MTITYRKTYLDKKAERIAKKLENHDFGIFYREEKPEDDLFSVLLFDECHGSYDKRLLKIDNTTNESIDRFSKTGIDFVGLVNSNMTGKLFLGYGEGCLKIFRK